MDTYTILKTAQKEYPISTILIYIKLHEICLMDNRHLTGSVIIKTIFPLGDLPLLPANELEVVVVVVLLLLSDVQLHILINCPLIQRLYVHLHGALVKVGEQRFCVAKQEVELLGRQLLNHQGAYIDDVAAAFDDQLVGQATVECAENKTANEDIL